MATRQLSTTKGAKPMETTGSGMVDQVAKNYREMLVWMGAFQVVKVFGDNGTWGTL